MKIRKLHLKNIGVFDNAEIDFRSSKINDKAEIHILTGENGSGKSTILMALANLFDSGLIPVYPKAGTNIPFLFLEGSNNNFYKRSRNESYISYDLQLGNEKRKYSFVNSIDSYTHSIDTFGEIGFTSENFFSFESDIDSTLHSYSNALKSKTYPSVSDFAVFAFSGYRRIKAERIEAIYEPKNFNPLSQSLEFVKDYSQQNQITINQLIANNFSKRAIERERNPQKSAKFARVLSTVEQAIFEITNWKIEFDLQTEPINLIAKVNGEELDFDVLPDGLRSLISWMADLLGRVDLLKWQDDLPINEKNLILFLDEIEVHLHPAWQRKVLPVVQKLFKNSQIFISTHSPFVVNSVDDAWVYKLELDENGKAHVADVVKSEDGHSYSHVLSEIFDIKEEFGVEVQKDLAKFKELRNKILVSKNGSEKTEKELRKLANTLADQSEELQTIVEYELRQINKRTGKSLSI